MPNSIPVIYGRRAFVPVYTIAWAILAFYIGVDELSYFVFNGLNLYRPNLILADAISAMDMAILADLIFAWVEGSLNLLENKKKSLTEVL